MFINYVPVLIVKILRSLQKKTTITWKIKVMDKGHAFWLVIFSMVIYYFLQSIPPLEFQLPNEDRIRFKVQVRSNNL